MKKPGERALACLVVAILAAVVGLSYRPVTTLLSSALELGPARVALSHIGRVRSLLASLHIAEAGAWGNYVETWPHAANPLLRELESLRSFVSGEPAQRDRLDQVASLVRRELERAGHAGRGDVGTEESEIGALLDALERGESARSRAAEAGVRASARVLTGFGLAAVAAALAAAGLALAESTRRRRVEGSASWLLRIAEQAGDLVAVTDGDGRIEFVNGAVEEATGYSREELVGRRGPRWLPWHADADLAGRIRAFALSGLPFRGAAPGRRKSGEPLLLEETATPLLDDAGRVARVVSTARDITRQKALEDRLDYLDRYDPLTGTPGRKHLVEILQEKIDRAREAGCSLAVLIADVDRFKYVNAAFGSQTGDEILMAVARALCAAVGEGDLVARIGSDQFAVAVLDGQPARGLELAEWIRRAVPERVPTGEHEFTVTVTTGIARYPDDGEDAPGLLQSAELALASAKFRGRNAIAVFDRSLAHSVPRLLSFEKRLFGALANREYLLRYQPYCRLATEEVAGAEALIQWRNGALGVVSPGRFIPTLEETGMIIDVGRWVLETACGQLQEWEARGQKLPVSVNLSPGQFRHKHLVPMVSDALSAFRIDPARLTLEVTEGVFLEDVEFAIQTLKRLKDVGVSLSVDDFGSGYSSLGYLKKLPVDSLKIDISFVRDVARDQDAASIVTAITTLARGLGLTTIAEGVETAEQRNVLHLLRCDMGQGYYFSPPVTAPDLDSFLAGGRPGRVPVDSARG